MQPKGRSVGTQTDDFAAGGSAVRWSATVTALTVMRALGFMAAAHPVVLLGLIPMRRLQRWFAILRLAARKHSSLDYCTPSMQEDIRYCEFQKYLLAGTLGGLLCPIVAC